MSAKIRILLATVGMIATTVGWSSASRATTLYTPVNGDSRGYTADGNWGGSGIWRAECALNEYAKGVSRWFDDSGTNPGFVHGLWCYGNGGSNFTSATTLDLSNGDSRPYPSFGGDWDPGYYKAECNNQEMLSGISQNSNGQVVYGRCESATYWPYSADATSCHRVDFTTQDQRSGSSLGGDWDPTFGKNQCADDEAVKGFSVYQGSSWKIRSIYCCHYTINF